MIDLSALQSVLAELDTHGHDNPVVLMVDADDWLIGYIDLRGDLQVLHEGETAGELNKYIERRTS